LPIQRVFRGEIAPSDQGVTLVKDCWPECQRRPVFRNS
jgi:hypothetical protein